MRRLALNISLNKYKKVIRMADEIKLEHVLEFLQEANLSPETCSSREHHGEILMAETNIRAGSSPPDYSLTHSHYSTYPMTPSHDMSAYEAPLEGQSPPPNGILCSLNRTVCSTMEYPVQSNVFSSMSAIPYETPWSMSMYSEDIHIPNNYRSYSPTEDTTEYQGNCQYFSQTSCDSDDSFEVPNTDRSYSNTSFEHTRFPVKQNNEQIINASMPSNRLPNFSTFIEKNKPSRRGRPVTYNKPGYHFSDSDSLHSDEDDTRSIRCRRGAKNILLWKFLLSELSKPNCPHIKWEDERNGIFKFIDTAECSRLWGQMKKKDDMNFEKLSRGIRHYYKDGLMSRRDGIRLVYQFNWHRVPKQFWPKTYRSYSTLR